MRKYLIVFLILLIGSVNAEPIKITPAQRISTSKKEFCEGNTYKFKGVEDKQIYTGTITYYKPNGINGSEAQIEISNFTNSNGELVPGKITVIPTNHKKFQESTEMFMSSFYYFVRGSEVILKPGKQIFEINNPISNNINNLTAISITPVQEISTVHDEIEVGDKIAFKIKNDTYKNGKLFLKADTPIYGTVDYLDENGWCGDNAVIHLKDFTVMDADGKIIKFNSALDINGFENLKYKSKRFAQFFNYLSAPVRGKEVDIKSCDNNVVFHIILK